MKRAKRKLGKVGRMKRVKRPAPLVKTTRKAWIVVHATNPTKAIRNTAHASRGAAISYFCSRVLGGTDVLWAKALDDGFRAIQVRLTPKGEPDGK